MYRTCTSAGRLSPSRSTRWRRSREANTSTSLPCRATWGSGRELASSSGQRCYSVIWCARQVGRSDGPSLWSPATMTWRGGSLHSALVAATCCTQSTNVTSLRISSPSCACPALHSSDLNTAAGIDWQTLTLNPRDLSITGALRLDQLESAGDRFRGGPPGDARVVVMHHNPLRGELSQRIGLVRSTRAMNAFAAMGVDLILCGHDHQEAIHGLDRTPNSPVVVTAGTVSCRSRGGRPSSLNIVSLTQTAIEVETQVWNASVRRFEPGVATLFRTLIRLLRRGAIDPSQLQLPLDMPGEWDVVEQPPAPRPAAVRPPRAPRRRPRPTPAEADAMVAAKLTVQHAEYNSTRFDGSLKPISITVSRRLRSRLAYYRLATPGEEGHDCRQSSTLAAARLGRGLRDTAPRDGASMAGRIPPSRRSRPGVPSEGACRGRPSPRPTAGHAVTARRLPTLAALPTTDQVVNRVCRTR